MRISPLMGALAAAVIALALVGPSSASAVPPQDVTFAVSKPLRDPGNFTASGAIDDSGVFQWSDFHRAALPSPVVGVEHFTMSFTGTNGNITMQAQLLFRATSNPNILRGEGEWRIDGGTGMYASLLGDGTFVEQVDLAMRQVTITLQGQVH